MLKFTRLAAFAGALLAFSPAADAQSCRLSTATGGSSTVTILSGYEASGTKTQTDALDANYYQLTNALGLGPAALVRTTYSNWVQTAADNSICPNCDPSGGAHPVVYGSAFVNPTNNPITVTQVDLTSNVDHFTPVAVTGVAPATGWTFVNRRLVRWTGSIVVPSRGAQDFVVADSPQNNAGANTTRQVQLNVSMTTSGGAFTAPAFTQTALTSSSNQASNAAVSFDPIGAANPLPRVFVGGLSSAAPIDLRIRVGETGSNGNGSQIETNLLLTVTIPERWSAVSVPTIGAPWNATTLAITQPTATTTGQITIRTNARILAGASTPVNSLIIRATAPRSSVNNLFPFPLALSGLSRGGRTINSFNDSVVQVVANGTEAINSEFFSLALAGPVRQIALSTVLSVVDGPGGEEVDVQVQRNGTTWETISTVAVTSDTTVSRDFTTDFLPYVDASNRMKIRFLSNGATVRTLRLDQIRWAVTLGYTVDNVVGNDSNAGDVARPFQTLARATTAVGPGGAAYVEVGASQSGSPYASNIAIAAAGTAACKTLFLGVPNGGLLPNVRGITAVDDQGNVVDFGFDIAADHVQVERFQVENTGAAVIVEPGADAAVVSSNEILAATNGYGVVVNPASGTIILNNNVLAGVNSPLFGVLDSGGSLGTLIDGNKIVGMTSGFSIYADGASPIIQRNILSNQFFGIYLARTTGTATVYNNTVDSTMLSAIEAENAEAVISRNNILVNGDGPGIRSNTPGTVDSDYDNVFGNFVNYQGVTPGPNSKSVDPLFVQTTDPSLSTFYRLNGGSPCTDAGVNVGLPFLGAAPDMGAVETQ